MKKEFKYKLLEPIEVSVDGKIKECCDVVVSSPRPRDKQNTLKLETYLMKAISNFTDNQTTSNANKGNSGKEEKISEASKIQAIEVLVFSNINPDDIPAIEFLLYEILCGGNEEVPNATIGSKKFTKPLCQEISHRDLKALLARFAVDFLFLDLI